MAQGGAGDERRAAAVVGCRYSWLAYLGQIHLGGWLDATCASAAVMPCGEKQLVRAPRSRSSGFVCTLYAVLQHSHPTQECAKRESTRRTPCISPSTGR